MNKNWLESYLSFSKKERNAVVVLVILITGIFVMPHFFPKHNKEIEQDLVAAIEKAVANEKADSMKMGRENYRPELLSSGHSSGKAAALFQFDPNTLSEDGWMKLGLKQRTAATIVKYVSKGGKFRQAADLYKIFGLSPELAARLIPYVKINQLVRETNFPSGYKSVYPERKNKPDALVDINKADSAGFIALKGIGPTLAGRIIKFRDKLGGFYAINQVAEVYGLPDSNFQKLISAITISEIALNKINVNSADLVTLANHPYIGRKLANIIIQYRQQHGNYKTLNELLGIDLINPELLKRLSPYLSLD